MQRYANLHLLGMKVFCNKCMQHQQHKNTAKFLVFIYKL